MGRRFYSSGGTDRVILRASQCPSPQDQCPLAQGRDARHREGRSERSQDSEGS